MARPVDPQLQAIRQAARERFLAQKERAGNLRHDVGLLWFIWFVCTCFLNVWLFGEVIVGLGGF